MVKFNPDKDIPDLTGRIIIVTGGTDGLGKESVLQLSKHSPAHIYLAARSSSKAETAIAEIQSKSPKSCPITFLELDLNSLESVKTAARTFLSRESRLDILMCNAGVMGAKGTTKDGYEMAFGINHVGHALLIKLLLPTMLETAKSTRQTPNTDPDVRVVILASEAEKFAPKDAYLLSEVQVKSDLGGYNVFARYGQSKLANVHHALSLSQKYPEPESGVKFVSVHPGGVTTNLGNELMANWPRVLGVIRKVASVLIGLVPVEEGAYNQLWAATATGGVVKNGTFYHPVGLEGKGSARTTDQKMADELWGWTEKALEGQSV